jgi:hypothetical protein
LGVDFKAATHHIEVFRADSNQVIPLPRGESKSVDANQFKSHQQVGHGTNRNDFIEEAVLISHHPNEGGNFCDHHLKTSGLQSAGDQLSLIGKVQGRMKECQNSEGNKSNLNAACSLDMQLGHDLSTKKRGFPVAIPAPQTCLPRILTPSRTSQTLSSISGSKNKIEVDVPSSSQLMNLCHQKNGKSECNMEKLKMCPDYDVGNQGSNKFLLPHLAVHKAEAKRGKLKLKTPEQSIFTSKPSFSFLPVTGPMREIRALQNKIRMQAEQKSATRVQVACERRRIIRMEQNSTELRDGLKRRELEVLNAALSGAFDTAKEQDYRDSVTRLPSSILQSQPGQVNNSGSTKLLISKNSNKLNNGVASDTLNSPQTLTGVTSKAYLNLPMKIGSRSLAFTCGFQSLALVPQK